MSKEPVYTVENAELFMTGFKEPYFTFTISTTDRKIRNASGFNDCLHNIAQGTRIGTTGPNISDPIEDQLHKSHYNIPSTHCMAMAKLFEDGGFKVTKREGFVPPPSNTEQPLSGPTDSLPAPQNLLEFLNYCQLAIEGKLQERRITHADAAGLKKLGSTTIDPKGF